MQATHDTNALPFNVAFALRALARGWGLIGKRPCKALNEAREALQALQDALDLDALTPEERSMAECARDEALALQDTAEARWGSLYA